MNKPEFKDHFSKQSGLYVKYRPHYPNELYSFLSSLTESHDLCWDCGTGNGQAAIGLSAFYSQVIATDPSAQQIANCIPQDNITYKVEKAENNSIASGSVDLLTIANALHWFDFDIFYKEAARILKPNGIIAAWSYGIPSVSPEIDEIVQQFNDEVVDEFWQYENRLVEKGYSSLPFPFPPIESQQFSCERYMNLENFTAYFETWSATQRFIDHYKYNPTEQLRLDLGKVWGEPASEKKLTWKLAMKIGRINMLNAG